MSERYVPVQWNRYKIVYDIFVLAAVFAWVTIFRFAGARVFEGVEALNSQIVQMRAWGTCAFAMLTAILMIGPLARLDRRFLPVLYNRRHLGVIFFFVAANHARHVLDFYHAWGPVSKWESLFTWDAAFTSASVPFQLFGLAALVVFLVMAATSHDFWQKTLGPRFWKSLHLSVYLAYALVVAHVAFGALQLERGPGWTALVGISVVLVGGLHVVSAIRSTAPDAEIAPTVKLNERAWLDAGPAADLVPGRATSVVGASGERIAVIRHADGISAVEGVCAHQGGPLGEGRVIDGCLTCPWHGWQYAPGDGCAPAPFTEKIPTHRIVVDERGHILVDPAPLAAGTPVPPAVAPETETRDA